MVSSKETLKTRGANHCSEKDSGCEEACLGGSTVLGAVYEPC